jgi:hypothetical protein
MRPYLLRTMLRKTFTANTQAKKVVECPICRVEFALLTRVDQVPKNYGLIPEDIEKVKKRSLNEFLSTIQKLEEEAATSIRSSNSTTCMNARGRIKY